MRNLLWKASAGLLLGIPLAAQTADPTIVRQGAVLFRQECVFCHGVGARGGVRGPDLTTGSFVHGGSDADLTRTISDGVPGTAMPSNRLNEEEIRMIVGYLRTLQQPAAVKPAGNASRGETLFFGGARCATCHIVNGRGGRLGPELSYIGSSRPRAHLVESIRDPNRQLSESPAGGVYDTVTAVTRDGRTLVGLPMNEDTFTIQLIDRNETVHSLEKKSLKSYVRENQSLMPAYTTSLLGDHDLEDVVAYLQTLRAPSPAAEKTAKGSAQ